MPTPLDDFARTLEALAKRVRALETAPILTRAGSSGEQIRFLRDLLDVNIVSPPANPYESLTLNPNSGKWEGYMLPRNLSELNDVNITSFVPESGNALIFQPTPGTSFGRWIPGEVQAGAGSGLVGGIWLFSNTGAIVDTYDATALGLADALMDSQDGYALQLPVCVIPHSFTLPTGVKILGAGRFSSVIQGSISLSPNSSLEALSVIRNLNSSDDSFCIKNPSTGTAFVSNCHVQCLQNGTGDSFGISIDGNGSIEVYGSHLEGYSQYGEGYGGALISGSGSLYHFGGRAVGSTTPYKE